MNKIILLLIFLVTSIFAEERPNPLFNEGTVFGKSNAAKVSEGVKAFNPQQVPGFSSASPKETTLDASNLSEAAISAAAQSDIGKIIRQGHQQRPSNVVDKNEPWLRQGRVIEQSDNPAQVLASHYTDCKTIQPQAVGGMQLLTCDEYTTAETKNCMVNQVVEVEAKTEKKPTCISGTIIATGTGALTPSVHCDVDSASVNMDFACIYNNYRVTYPIALNSRGRLNFKGCGRKHWSAGKPKYKLSCVKEQCHLSVNVHGQNGDDINVQFERPRTITTLQHTVVKDYQNTNACDLLQKNPNCTVAKETCVEGDETRTINGKSIHKACWRWQREYACLGDTQSDCEKLSKDCQKEDSVCIAYSTSDPNKCLSREHRYLCPTIPIGQPPLALDCSDQRFCLNGNCYDTSFQASPDFAKAVSNLSVIKDIQNKLDPNNLSLFTGQKNTCRKWPLKSLDCCNDSGWAQDVLVSCKENEKQLYQQRKNNVAHEVGSYCSDKGLFGGCLEKKKTFCAFDSKLGRMVQEQGRKQLGLSWGDAKHPNCRGFAPQELQKLNFEQMDFTEYYQDVWQKTQLPKEADLTKKVGQQIQDYYQQGVSHAPH